MEKDNKLYWCKLIPHNTFNIRLGWREDMGESNCITFFLVEDLKNLNVLPDFFLDHFTPVKEYWADIRLTNFKEGCEFTTNVGDEKCSVIEK